jgi:hypothetical protein
LWLYSIVVDFFFLYEFAGLFFSFLYIYIYEFSGTVLICFYILFKMYYVEMASQPTPEGPTWGGGDKGDKDKAQWTTSRTKIFIELCNDEVLKGNRPTSTFNKKGWRNIGTAFFKQEGLKYDQKQLKNKYAGLKRIWSSWCKLDSHTGIGKDPITGGIICDDETWQLFVEANPDCIAFRKTPPAHLNELSTIFGGTTATRENSWAPSMGTHSAFEGSTQLDEIDAIEQSVPITPLESQPEQEAIGLDQENIDANRRRRRSTSSVGGLRRRRRDVHLTARDKVDAQIGQVCDALLSTDGDMEISYTVRDCIKELDMLDAVVKGSAQYMNALLLFRDPINRETWMTVDSSLRVNWLDFMRTTTSTQPPIPSYFPSSSGCYRPSYVPPNTEPYQENSGAQQRQDGHEGHPLFDNEEL